MGCFGQKLLLYLKREKLRRQERVIKAVTIFLVKIFKTVGMGQKQAEGC